MRKVLLLLIGLAINFTIVIASMLTVRLAFGDSIFEGWFGYFIAGALAGIVYTLLKPMEDA